MSTRHPERTPLAHLPTPLVRLERLEKTLDCGPIWLKRDDLTGLELSGNKVRKLEYVVADALATGCDTLVTEGTPQSNHCRATAAACAKVGLRCHLLLRPEPPGGPPAGNHLLDALFGAEVSAFPREPFEADREQIVKRTLAEISARRHRPRFTPAARVRAARLLGVHSRGGGAGGSASRGRCRRVRHSAGAFLWRDVRGHAAGPVASPA